MVDIMMLNEHDGATLIRKVKDMSKISR